ncbi:hypothetical protein [Streptomyces sp. R08]|uniref:Uncharacterized protein n=1 Tax=Streptomyces sp. R08 TaxID=3238624 RepID=A0AB39MKH4_9ACTN
MADAAERPWISWCTSSTLFEEWMRLRAEGVRPAVVPAEQAVDAGYLTARGFKEVVRPE